MKFKVTKSNKDKVVVDGREQQDSIIKLSNDKQKHKVEMYIK